MTAGDYATIDDALVGELRALLEQGYLVDSRVGRTKELRARTIHIERPTERFMNLRGRYNNPIAQVAETLWVMSGRNDIEWLSHYLPRAAEFSDNGKTWRAGYGPRLFHWKWNETDGVGGVAIDGWIDQVRNVINRIQREPNTRRAVISLWDPTSDHGEYKDIPCNNWIQFLPRDGKLHMYVVARSNDIMWGWSGINAFEWSVLQEIVANSCDLDVGSASYFIGSLHLYERHWTRAANIVNANGHTQPYTDRTPSAKITSDLDPWRAQVANLMREEPKLRELTDFRDIHDFDVVVDPWLRQATYMLGGFAYFYNTGKLPDWSEVAITDGVRAASDYLDRMYRAGDGPADVPKQGVAQNLPDPDGEAWNHLRAEVVSLQESKGKAYGDSWKKHGELISIFANISRKYDRFHNITRNGGTATTDETLVDTVMDLAIYATLYLTWLSPGLTFDQALDLLELPNRWKNPTASRDACETGIGDAYAALERMLTAVPRITPSYPGTTTGVKLEYVKSLARCAYMWLIHFAQEPLVPGIAS